MHLKIDFYCILTCIRTINMFELNEIYAQSYMYLVFNQNLNIIAQDCIIFFINILKLLNSVYIINFKKISIQSIQYLF